jgi:hypothetical protein
LPDTIAGLEAWATSSLGLFVLAAIGVLLAGAVSARLERHWRKRRAEGAKRRQAERDPMAEIKPTPALTDMVGLALEPPWYAACEQDRKKEDDKAVQLQSRYHSCVARCIGVLSVGVVIICLSIVVYRDVAWLEKFATDFDLIATLYALAFFFGARIANNRFVIARSFVETLRAWTHLAIVFPLERGIDAISAYQARKKEIAARYWEKTGVLPPKDAATDTSHRPDKRETLIYRRVEECWTEIHDECRAVGLRSPPSSAQIGFYLKTRPLVQLGFFIAAQGRIYAGQKSREWLMTVLYVASVVLAVLKALSVFQTELPTAVAAHTELVAAAPVDWISTALLVVMVLSAAATNAYVSRNERSLLHAYHAQERRIKKWFEDFAAAAGTGGGRYAPATMLAFEDIMLNDLLDFIHITSRDVIEVPH